MFADVDPVTLNLDPVDVAAKITDRTRAIMPVHLFGRPAAMDELAALGLPLIEDAAQAFGAPGVATRGVVSTYSFFPTKNLFCLGDGGLVATSDEELADRVQMLAFHGSRDKTDFDFVGYNSRLDELQAGMLRIFLEQLDGWNRGRREAAARYAELGLGELVELPLDEPGHIYHLFVCRSPERDRIRAALSEAEIGSATYYTTPLHLQPALRFLGYEAGLAARDGAGRRGELLRSALARHAGRGAGACRRRRPLRGRRRRPGRMTGIGRHRLLQLLADAAIVAVAWVLAFELRFDQGLPVYYDTLLRRTILLVVVIKLAVFLMFGFHRRWWRYVSVRDMWSAARGVVVASILAYVTVYFVAPVHGIRLPRSIAVMDLLITLALIAGVRLAARTLIERPRFRRRRARQGSDRRRGGRRRTADRPGDAALAHARRTRRSASSTTTRASGTRASTASACSARWTICRASCASSSRTRC